MPSVLRILDANANRAREALRVMEEAARFLLDDPQLTGAIKALRHDLATALSSVHGLVASRDTPGDVGTTIKAETEMQRGSVADVAIAAGKRLSEALRALEEYGKTLGSGRLSLPRERAGVRGATEEDGPAFARRIESLRYRGYALEQQLYRALGTSRRRQWRLCVLLSENLCPRGDWLAVAEAALAGGADCLQLREKTLDAGEVLLRARRLVQLAHARGASVIVNDRPELALLAGADGVHLGQTDLPCAEARRLVGRQLLIGISTARLAQAEQAWRDGADYCGVGPMFPTTTKHKDVIAGPAYLREYLAWDQLPHLAIGGITRANLPELVAAGVRGIAVSSAVCSASDPAAAARELVRLLPAS